MWRNQKKYSYTELRLKRLTRIKRKVHVLIIITTKFCWVLEYMNKIEVCGNSTRKYNESKEESMYWSFTQINWYECENMQIKWIQQVSPKKRSIHILISDAEIDRNKRNIPIMNSDQKAATVYRKSTGKWHISRMKICIDLNLERFFDESENTRENPTWKILGTKRSIHKLSSTLK